MKVSVKVPATTANVGPGFDCFGMALPIYNKISVEETVYPTTGLQINIYTPDGEEVKEEHIPRDESSIVYQAIELLYNYTGQVPPAMKIKIETGIPLAKGLGSSASVIVGGLIAANKLLGDPADEAALLAIANEVEGHPDNVTPAMIGGFVISSAEEDNSIQYRKVEWPGNWKLTVCIPDYELATDISRSVLPEEVPIEDAAYNARKCAMFIHALHTKDSELMKLALKDRLHQQYRTKLIPGFDEVVDALRSFDNVLGVVLSGAGPSMLVISEGNGISEITNTVRDTWEDMGVKVIVKTVEIETQGARII